MAAELAQASYQVYPNTWEWLGRINKLRQELELCRSDF
nr:MAG TPA: PalH/RIM21 [Caudoviricetes sp.]